MTLFVYNWNFITKHDLYNAFTAQKIAYYVFTTKSSPRSSKEKETFIEELDKALDGRTYDAIFSINYMEELAKAAHDRDVPYIAWCYDSPSVINVTEVVNYETIYIFLFDFHEYTRLSKAGAKTVYYLPLAVNVKRLDQMWPSRLQKQDLQSDISFVGQLYQSDMDKIFPLFDEYGAGYIAAIINTQLKVYGTTISGDLINENVVKKICNKDVSDALVKNLNSGYYKDVEDLYTCHVRGFVNKAVTNKERVLLLSLLAKYHQVKLFTINNPKLPNVDVRGSIDYVTQMPLVFKCSKINLNITLRNIASGIPQRILDIMGCHGLVLSNYQEDIFKYFKDGRDILVYSSMEEALDKCNYYLAHETEAARIRQNGYHIVSEQFSYEHQLNQIWEISGLKSKLDN